MKVFFTLFILLLTHISFAQPKQTVRGKVVDNETNFPLLNAKVEILTSDSTIKYRTLTDIEGDFILSNIPVGKHILVVSLYSHESKQQTIEVISGKETIVQISLIETYTEQPEVVILGRKKGEVINEMALLSAQQFSVEETNRYPGSRSDPARMASNFAGVQGADDSRNDIIIRGNSPLGVVWKVEGIDIPNPSHFAISGSTGGPVSILNNKILGNSDFFMSAFPAQYGNSISGVFDLKLRNGNNLNHEFTGQFGFLGTEFLAEGPMGKNKKASYLVMGRYSTLSLFKTLGISIGTDAVPTYGDFAYKFNWRLKNGGNLSLFGIAGASNIAIQISDQKTYSKELYGEGDRDQYFGTSMGVTGLVYKKTLNEKTFITSTIAISREKQHANHNLLVRHLDSTQTNIIVDSIYPLMGYYFTTIKTSGYFSVNHKLDKNHLLKCGINVDGYFFDMLDSVLDNSHFINRWNYKGTSVLIQPFIQWKWRMKENIDFTFGLHNQYFSLSNSFSQIEPRAGWKLRMKKDKAVFAGLGIHSQTQPNYTYLYHFQGTSELHNKKMGFSQSFHAGIGFEKAFKNKLNIRSEAYYQYLYRIPVTVTPSSFSMINMGSGFARFFPEQLQNTGIGYNYGVELTLQKYFDKSFFFMLSSSLYQSKYRGSDGVLRNTSYNGNHVSNILAGKEFKLNSKQSITISTKITYAGGKRYGYVNLAKSEAQKELIYSDSAFNERQFKEYFRMDLKINWKLNANKMTHEIGLDLINIFNTKNLLSLAYAPNLANPNAEPISVKQQLGFLPLFYYRIDFKAAVKKVQ
ncbi:MAG: TonB-dependent receptor [Flavobacteriia bacterium]|nr:TonB-dependent receptor [Flavobacteriia bacterium]